MVEDLDIHRTANILVQQHGADAPSHFAMRADKLLETGGLDGYAVFKRVIEATVELLTKDRRAKHISSVAGTAPSNRQKAFVCETKSNTDIPNRRLHYPHLRHPNAVTYLPTYP